MVESKLTYEECRRQRVEENKKRMEELNLSNLALALKPKSSPAKQGKPRARLSSEMSAMPVRRSGRMADKPPPNYKEMAMEPLGTLRRSYGRRDLLDRIRATDRVRLYAIKRAETLESELGSQFPTFIKPMLQSHVSRGFWLGLPVGFCNKHMPQEDELFSLVDEDDDVSEAKYLADKRGLSGGWRGFSLDHSLVDGDALVFQLVKPTEFKVHIIRAGQSGKKDGNGEEIEEISADVKVKPLSRGSRKKSRARRRATYSDDDDDDDDSDDNDDDDDNDYKVRKKSEDIEVTASSRRSSRRTRARASQSDDDTDIVMSKEDVGVESLGKRSRARKK